MKTKNVTFNYHQWCLTPEDFTRSNLTENYIIITTNQDHKNSHLEFISTFEHKTLPIYGVQWHPEKNQFEFRINKHYNNIPHDENAVLIGQYFANFFINETRKSYSQFKNASIESKYLIYNYNTTYTGAKENQSFEQIYVFAIPS